MDGLKQVMAVKSRVVLPYLVPKVQSETSIKLQNCALSLLGLSILWHIKRKSRLGNFLPVLCSKCSCLDCDAFLFGNFSCCRLIEFFQKLSAHLKFFGVFLADYSPCEHPRARFPLVGGRGCSDSALECHPACNDVCAQGEAGDQ